MTFLKHIVIVIVFSRSSRWAWLAGCISSTASQRKSSR